ncbi:MAG: protease SohB [Thiopseudomonas sp.]|nr:protease SohB [Thiopseudomonas sp.]MCK9465102.1 protease SohB [Thiopseudomonas sp.]
MDFILDYAGFLLRAVTVIIVVVVILAFAASAKGRGRSKEGSLHVKSLNEFYGDLKQQLQAELLDKKQLKAVNKQEADKAKHAKKQKTEQSRVFVLDFAGDIKASAADSLRHEVTALLSMAKKDDEVVLRLESTGGMVHSYGFAASQLARIRQAGIPLTICVDKVAASGGYMMACLGDKILSAPFAILGSVGVVAQLPNIHRLLKKHDIDVEILTAGEYKRTLTVLGENTEQGRKKFLEDLQTTHDLFKEFVVGYRPQLDINKVATGEIWLGTDALKLELVDQLQTSDEYLSKRAQESKVYALEYAFRKSMQERIGLAALLTTDSFLLRWWERLLQQRFWR